MSVDKNELIRKPNLSCLGALSENKIEQIQNACQNFFVGEKVSEFVLILSSEGGHPFHAQGLASHLALCQQNGVQVSVWIREMAFSAAAILVLYSKYLGLNVYAEPSSLVLFHEPKRSYELLPISTLQKSIEREREKIQEILNVYSEVSGISPDILYKEFLEEKELDVDDLRSRNLIDDIVE